MQTKATGVFAKLVCLILAVLMLIVPTLPIITLSGLRDMAEEMLEKVDDSDTKVIFGVVLCLIDSGFAKGVLDSFTEIELSDFGSKQDDYGYSDDYDDDYWDIRWDLEDDFYDYWETIDDAVYYEDYNQAERTLSKEKFQDITAEILSRGYLEIAYDEFLYGNYIDNVETPYKKLQTVARTLEDGAISMVELPALLNALAYISDAVTTYAQEEEADNLLKYFEPINKYLKIASPAVLAIIALYSICVIAAVIFVFARKKGACLTFCGSAVVITLLQLIAMLLLFKKINPELNTLMTQYIYNNWGEYLRPGNTAIINLANGLYFALVLGIVMTVAIALLWNVGCKVPRTKNASGWVCECGNHCAKDMQFCSRCGTKRPVVKESKCKACGAELKAGSKFCSKCGTAVVAAKEKVQDIYCWRCNSSVAADTRFCSACGADLSAPVSTSSDPA